MPESRRVDLQLSFGWRIENPANGRAIEGGGGGYLSRLPLNCEFSSGVATFEVVVKLSVYHYGLATSGTVTRSAVITRAPGECGT